MKERILYDDDFEKQLKEKSDQLKMYPSDKVWNEVYNNLHTGRRKFVAGMSFLIGGILILAGSQLLFPSKTIEQKSVAVKINAPVKPAATKAVNNFTADNFTADPAEEPLSGSSLNPALPFELRSSYSPELRTSHSENPESLPETIQYTASLKPIQPVETSVASKTSSSLSVPEIAEPEMTASAYTVANSVSTELVQEKTAGSLSKIRNDRFSWELYIAPTLNTHYLYGLNYQTMTQTIQNAPIRVGYFTNVSGLVDNTPLLGYDVGGNILYRISKNISLKAGLEFSFSRYYIKAYNSNSAQASATLNSYLGYVADSLINYNSSSSINKNPQHYQNRYYQLSLPVGVEMKVAGKGKIQLHLGATIQPSYLLNTDAYVLSDDYINYVKDPQAFRRWNLNVGGQVYLSYAVGKIRWELGPQVRYQLFSTYKNDFPVQENMLNYGIRIGISKTIR